MAASTTTDIKHMEMPKYGHTIYGYTPVSYTHLTLPTIYSV